MAQDITIKKNKKTTMSNRYLIYVQCSFEIDGEDEIKAKEAAEPLLKQLEEKSKELGISFRVENARIADKKTGYFLG